MTNLKIFNFIIILFTVFSICSSSFAKNPSNLIKEIVDQASTILSSEISEEEKINKLNEIAEIINNNIYMKKNPITEL